MKKRFIIFFCIFSLLLSITTLICFKNPVLKFKILLATNSPRLISNYVEYPFQHGYHFPIIRKKEDFIKNYDLIFDWDFKKKIIFSNSQDWDEVGWRGIMLNNGELWIDYDGSLKHINFESSNMINYKTNWKEKIQKNLHKDLKEYHENILIFKTSTQIGRIDQMEKDNHNSYRLSLWNKGKKMTDKPDIVIFNGEIECGGYAGCGYFWGENYRFDQYVAETRDCDIYREDINLESYDFSGDCAYIIAHDNDWP